MVLTALAIAGKTGGKKKSKTANTGITTTKKRTAIGHSGLNPTLANWLTSGIANATEFPLCSGGMTGSIPV
jgi:hypothetical protein